MDSKWEVRRAGAEDVDRICQLVNSAYRGDSSRQGWTTEADFLDGQRTDEESLAATLATPDTVFLLLHCGPELLGSVQLQKKEGFAFLGMLTVRPNTQGAGLGKILLAAAEGWAQANWGVNRIRMSVIQKRHELISWYERRSYRRTTERAPFPYGDARFGLPKVPDLEFLILEKELPAVPQSNVSVGEAPRPPAEETPSP
jgi:ribosomal protein S18 acetylase RimI-like enzyme